MEPKWIGIIRLSLDDIEACIREYHHIRSLLVVTTMSKDAKTEMLTRIENTTMKLSNAWEYINGEFDDVEEPESE